MNDYLRRNRSQYLPARASTKQHTCAAALPDPLGRSCSVFCRKKRPPLPSTSEIPILSSGSVTLQYPNTDWSDDRLCHSSRESTMFTAGWNQYRAYRQSSLEAGSLRKILHRSVSDLSTPFRTWLTVNGATSFLPILFARSFESSAPDLGTTWDPRILYCTPHPRPLGKFPHHPGTDTDIDMCSGPPAPVTQQSWALRSRPHHPPTPVHLPSPPRISYQVFGTRVAPTAVSTNLACTVLGRLFVDSPVIKTFEKRTLVRASRKRYTTCLGNCGKAQDG